MAYDQSAHCPPAELEASPQRPTAVDLFCGIGGMSLGFEQAGFDVVAAVDIDPLLAAVHKYNHPRTITICASVTSLLGAARQRLGVGSAEIDVVFGGPPCQGFSLIGKRRVDDERNDLVRAFLQVAIELAPRYIVMENVEGILQPAMAQHMTGAKALLRAAGYEFHEPTKVDASEYGVPQRRRRVFLVAWRAEQKPFVWPTKTHGKPGSDFKSFVTVQDAIGDLSAVRATPKSGYARELGRTTIIGTAAPRIGSPRLLTGLQGTAHKPDTIRRFRETEEGKEEPVSRYTRLAWNGLCHTMRAGTGPDRGSFMSARPIHPGEPRVINVREAARLHGYPDWFQFHRTKWHSFRGIGNSVPPPLAKAVAQQIFLGLDCKPAPCGPVRLRPNYLLQMSPAEAAASFGLDATALAKRRRSDTP